MALQLSTGARNAAMDAIESAIGVSPLMKIYTGSPPANCAAVDGGAVLATLTLPADWMTNASGGSKSISGTWSGTASAGGTAGHFRVLDSSGATCHMQGTVGIGTGDLQVDNTSFAAGQAFSINTATLTAGNS